jgi:prepilin-type N-terminal cleavage/methylation domain-containing protein
MKRSAPISRANGFTLLELLVALTVLGLLLVGLAQGD